MATPYLSTKTEVLASQQPVEPSQARAAQIPLQNFNLPTFPPEAFSAGLESLILTSDIKLDEYTTLLTQPFSIPDLPSTITSLTLELFSLGYPPSFLSELGKRLPGLKALTLYSQLFAGTTRDSHEDAVTFIRQQKSLREVHFLDVFAPHDVFSSLLSALGQEVKFVEISYTFRHSDAGFLRSVPGKDILAGLKGGLVGFTACVTSPEVTEDEEDREGTEQGMRPISGEGEGEVLVRRLKEVGEGLVMVDVTMFEVSVPEVQSILESCKSVRVLSLSVGLENGWGEVLNVIGKEGKGVGIEELEIVGVPRIELVERLKGSGGLVIEEGELGALGERCKGLKSLKVSVLRTGLEWWVRNGEQWVKKT
ncbi:uncharacterized protein K444DRAFT_610936 [Hyaloscypha bicolor E]|uniref:Uncharacterized protein n=1 Tax=Hyaloscypha bicolor E TaxID=1095630 RepID=A0A2J6TIV3_9HELO|nr:uncharacterized protein K444DRAFT_610936 [Hyaloscypha bicolor E]PMD62908.1 hypothetical protein K444DRAFT_610936 [Hyaloscypha bicolor E]